MQDKNVDIKCSFGIIIWHTDQSYEDLLKTIDSVKNIDYNKKSFGFVVCIKSKTANEVGIQTFVSMMQELKKQDFYSFFNVSHKKQSLKDQETACFGLVQQGTYLVKLNSGQEIEPTLFSSINKMTEEERKKYPIFKSNDITIVRKNLASSRYYHFEDYDDMIRGVTENDQESQQAYMLNENKR